ncbi:asparagine synthase-related protein [Streptomyces kanamyceticus]|uniref:Asparagine synthetase B family protein n=1 Tax=Streptomyces kanamyceticus TaxID=1967 RepID=A0A5J6G6B6_STRKN|nr:asparagine synthase-related protein [Streptomyces kanamyceticus]QEU90164.1 asparagine synthetase B family protein [Streptomyces kanamyceticus]
MSGDVWFAVLPDGAAGVAAARLLRPWTTDTVTHDSGRPWLLGSWPDGHVTVGVAGARRVAVIGRCPVTADTLSARIGRLRGVGDVERVAQGLHGSFHLVASAEGSVLARGSASGVRRLFHTRVAGVTVAADRSDRLAALTGADPDERLLAAHLLASPLPYPLDDRCVWRGVHALRSYDSLLLDAEGRATTRRWWTPPDPELGWRQGVPAVHDALTAAVGSCTAGGGTVSADLSGGMDSTSLCFLAAREQSGIRSAFAGARLVTMRWRSLDPDNDDEIWAARATSRLPDAEHVTPPRDQWPLWYSGLASLTDATAPAIPTDEPGPWVRDSARMAALADLMTGRGSRLHLMGGGADELFTTLPPHLHDHVRRNPWAAFARIRTQRAAQHWPLGQLLRQLADRRTFAQWLTGWADGLTDPAPTSAAVVRSAPSTAWGVDLRMPPWATPDAVRAVQSLLHEAAESAGTAAPLAAERGQHAALSCVRSGGRGLRQLDQVTSARGLPHAAPYLDDTVIEAALAIRVPERSTPGTYKPVLAAAMRDIVPADVLRRQTKGEYSTDFHTGLRHNRSALVGLFEGSQLARAGLIDAAAIRAALLGVHPTPEALRSFSSTLGSEIWLRSCRGSTRPPNTAITEGAP